ncbi:ATP-dependent RNA helicase [Candidatus Woesearchaeota archaeon]|nr:ATP-dependent RNA helicase [Candidatus Woesearchaeota archaeon]|tara:strand:- start:3144 stop:4352 length:1209 start_codon:yes stop_codon:yes gene_type:complete
MNVFEKFKLSKHTIEAIEKLGISEPTDIQSKSIPHILNGKDVIGESATGSGKTLAFGCGIVEKVIPGAGLQSLILTPTRELAEQVKHSLRQLAYLKRLNVLPIYGGVAIGPQIRDLPRTDVVVATPGRLLDHLERRTISLSKVNILVLDEADRMFDMGFIEDVEKIIKHCPAKKQTMLFSATIPPRIKDLVRKHMIDPVQISVDNQVDPSKLKQVYYDVSKNLKLSLLTHLLDSEKSGLVLVFCNTRRTTDFVVKNLQANKIDAISIHGGLSQNKRNRIINSFNRAKAHVLVCTNVAARGLHIDNVSHVYNYEIPKDPKDYVHRIGRTARAGEAGKAINLLCEYDYDNFSRILGEYRNFSIKKIDKPYLKRIIAIRPQQGRNRFPSRPRPAFIRNRGKNRFN